MMNQKEFAERRKKLMQQLGEGSAALFFSGREYLRNGDVHFPFRQDSQFYYFTGFNEPEAVAVLLPGRKQGEYILFNQPRDLKMERWVGKRVGQEGACREYEADESYDISLIKTELVALLSGRKSLFYPLGKDKLWNEFVTSLVTDIRLKNRKLESYPVELCDVATIANEFRLIKSQYEISCMRKAANISALAHEKLMKFCRPGLYEYELEACFNADIRAKGCSNVAYPTIVGSGKNACTLHYVENKDRLKNGDLVLIDAGGEYEYYAADITRTLPVNGKFTPDQKTIYELVLKTQRAVLSAIKPGAFWDILQKIAVEELTKGLLELGMLTGTLQQAIESKAYDEYYMHTIGHWLGLDVHDVGAYRAANQAGRRLEEGMVLTVEPGLYLSASDKLEPRWHDIGVRIEDDILVTKNGYEVLTEAVPKEIHDIEKLMKK